MKKFVFEYAPNGFVAVDGKYALMSPPVNDVSPYDENEVIKVALAVDMSEEVINNRWAQTYRVYWFKGDSFTKPSMISKEDLVEISPVIFVRKKKVKGV